MPDLVLDLRQGATSAALLGALVEVGASLEAVEAAVDTLGSGPVRLSVRGGAGGTAVRVFAPPGSPVAPTWGRLRPHVEHLALDAAVVTHALATLDALAAARALLDGCTADQVEPDPLAGPDELAGALGLAAALASLDATVAARTAVGHGTGTRETMEGPVAMPGAVVARLLEGVPTLPHAVAHELVDPLAAAYVAGHLSGVTLATTPDQVRPPGGPTGRGRLPGGGRLAATLSSSGL